MLADGPVLLRPYRRGDASGVVGGPAGQRGVAGAVGAHPARRRGRAELARGVPAGLPGPAAGRPRRARYAVRGLPARAVGRGAARRAAHPRQHRARGRFCSAYAGYWVDSRVAGRGIIPTALALAVDHAFGPGGLHRVEVNIRPENTPQRRVVEKLGFREEAYHARYLHIDGAWRDHIGYALTTEDVAADGGLLARWHRMLARRSASLFRRRLHDRGAARGRSPAPYARRGCGSVRPADERNCRSQ